jgi:hypothetical protein
MNGSAARCCGSPVPAPDGPAGRATRLPLRARSGAQPSLIVAPPQDADREEVPQGQRQNLWLPLRESLNEKEGIALKVR